MPVYPEKIKRLVDRAGLRESIAEPDASGRAVTFLCGVTVEFHLRIENASKTIRQAGFKTNGCGYMVAAAEFLASHIENTELTELHGLADFKEVLESELEKPSVGRQHCFDTSFEALQNAFADYRRNRIEVWNGEDALICSCFGVSETAIEAVILSAGVGSVEEVGDKCHAGTGCGSCQPLIQEILDAGDF